MGHLVVEALVKRRAETEMTTVVFLGSLAEDVSGGVPEDLLACQRPIATSMTRHDLYTRQIHTLWMFKIKEFELDGLFEWPLKIPELIVDLDRGELVQ